MCNEKTRGRYTIELSKQMLMKRLLFLAIGTLVSTAAFSQKNSGYNWAIGARAGSYGATCGVTAKVFVADVLALEGIISYWNKGITATLLLEYHRPAFETRSLNWYMGGGAHFIQNAGYENSYIVSRSGTDYVDGGSAIGIDGVFGLEYKIPVIPVALSIDVKPAAEFNAAGGFNMTLDPGLGIKLAF